MSGEEESHHIDTKKFFDSGYKILPKFFSREESELFATELISLVKTRPLSKSLAGVGAFESLATDRRIMKIVQELIGFQAELHHINGRLLAGDSPVKPWHHDFDGNRSDTTLCEMIHFMVYPRGLSSENGPLVVLPGSHKSKVSRAFPTCQGTDQLEGEHIILGEPGLLVLIDSALWHCRRAGRGRTMRPYFNLSYCLPNAERPERNRWLTVACDLLEISK